MQARVRDEQVFHDNQARRRAAQRPGGVCPLDDDWYLDHETWIRPALEQLTPVDGLRVLDLGCGHGMASIVLARRGAQVTALDLSVGYLQEARERGEASGVEIQWIQADGHRLPFPDRSFDRIWGNAILHHLDMKTIGQEIRRILKPGGWAVFCEPWGENPLLEFARRYLPYPGKERTPEETPLRKQDLETLQQIFPQMQWKGYQLLAMGRRLGGPKNWYDTLDRWDGHLLHRFPTLSRWCRYVVLRLPTQEN